MISFRNLPPECAGYVRNLLDMPEPLLKELSKLDFEGGNCFSFLPQSVHGPWGMGRPWSQSVDFSYAAGLNGEVIEPFVVDVIHEYLLQDPHHCVISLAPDQYKSLFREEENASCFFIDESVYYYVMPSDLTKEGIVSVLRDSVAFEMRVAFSSLPKDVVLRPQVSLAASVAAEIARNTEYLIVGAFDDEWIIVWDRQANPDQFLKRFPGPIEKVGMIDENDALYDPLRGSRGP